MKTIHISGAVRLKGAINNRIEDLVGEIKAEFASRGRIRTAIQGDLLHIEAEGRVTETRTAQTILESLTEHLACNSFIQITSGTADVKAKLTYMADDDSELELLPV